MNELTSCARSTLSLSGEPLCDATKLEAKYAGGSAFVGAGRYACMSRSRVLTCLCVECTGVELGARRWWAVGGGLKLGLRLCRGESVFDLMSRIDIRLVYNEKG